MREVSDEGGGGDAQAHSGKKNKFQEKTSKKMKRVGDSVLITEREDQRERERETEIRKTER